MLICVLFILCLTWTVNANSLKQHYSGSWLPAFCKQNLLLSFYHQAGPGWQLRRTYMVLTPTLFGPDTSSHALIGGDIWRGVDRSTRQRQISPHRCSVSSLRGENLTIPPSPRTEFRSTSDNQTHVNQIK